jgi:hypothetical protein
MQTIIGKICIQRKKLFNSLKKELIKYSKIKQSVNINFSRVFFE